MYPRSPRSDATAALVSFVAGIDLFWIKFPLMSLVAATAELDPMIAETSAAMSADFIFLPLRGSRGRIDVRAPLVDSLHVLRIDLQFARLWIEPPRSVPRPSPRMVWFTFSVAATAE